MRSVSRIHFTWKLALYEIRKRKYIYRGEMRRPFSPERKFIAYRQWPHMENNTQTQTHRPHRAYQFSNLNNTNGGKLKHPILTIFRDERPSVIDCWMMMLIHANFKGKAFIGETSEWGLYKCACVCLCFQFQSNAYYNGIQWWQKCIRKS